MVGRSDLRKGEPIVMGLDQRGSLLWRKSTASGSAGCVEVASAGTKIFVRDSKAPLGAFLTFSGEEWQAFVTYARSGQLNI